MSRIDELTIELLRSIPLPDAKTIWANAGRTLHARGDTWGQRSVNAYQRLKTQIERNQPIRVDSRTLYEFRLGVLGDRMIVFQEAF